MEQDMLRMQQEAVERVRQMQERARRYVERGQDPQREAAAEKGIEQEKSIEAAGGKEIQPGKGLNLLEGLNVDNDQLLLLMLAMLLARNDAPIELILALLYIAM
ncbi:MAG TPA: hypothetical protein PKX71_01410 [Candidatus Avimonas sp.]|jgi:hypothetical protein|nr:hypothetical protein [Clostridiales bacterium]HOB36133.1 hypothetical protein [Candidatus Avimonas sp.]HQA15604.1 hypothetical protein [Candidatus Avimonas sp.]HQD37718.1 hypothetical protein [Candidatus Avimonas sp.]